MTFGPGKYDDLCTYVREQADADGAIVIVIGGNKGPGFSLQADIVTAAGIADVLEQVAQQIRRDVVG